MKKRLLVILIIAVIAALVLSGCSGIFVTDPERDYKQVVAEIEYKGYSSSVLKGDLYDFFMNNAETLMQNGGYTVDDVLDQCATSLARNEILAIQAFLYFVGSDAGKVPSTYELEKMVPADYEKLLEPNEIYYAKENVYNQYKDLHESIIEEIETQQAAASGSSAEEENEESDADAVEPRKQPPAESTAFDRTVVRTQEEADKFVRFTDTVNGFDDIERRAWRELTKRLDGDVPGYRNYDFFYKKQLQIRLLEKYELAEKDKATQPTAAEITSKYATILRQNFDNSLTADDNSAYKTAYDTGGNLFYARQSENGEGYAKVRSLLLKFNEEQTAFVTRIKKGEYGYGAEDKTAYYKLLEQLVFGNAAFDAKYGIESGLKINVSNVKYDAETMEKDQIYTEKDVPFLTILDRLSTALTAAETTAIGVGGDETVTKAMYRLKAFDDFVYMTNDDTGAYADDGALKAYVVTPEGETSEYVPEYRDYSREVAKAGLGAVSVDTSGYTFGTTDYTGVETLTTRVSDNKKYGSFMFQYKGITFNVNEFGVHIVFVTNVALPAGQFVAYNEFIAGGATATEYPGAVLKLDTVFEYGYTYSYENFVYYPEKQKNVQKIVGELIFAERAYNLYNELETEFYNGNTDAIRRNTGVYDGLLSEIKTRVGA